MQCFTDRKAITRHWASECKPLYHQSTTRALFHTHVSKNAMWSPQNTVKQVVYTVLACEMYTEWMTLCLVLYVHSMPVVYALDRSIYYILQTIVLYSERQRWYHTNRQCISESAKCALENANSEFQEVGVAVAVLDVEVKVTFFAPRMPLLVMAEPSVFFM